MGIAVVFVATFGPVIFAKPEASEVSAPVAETTPNRRVTEQFNYPSVSRDEVSTVRESLKAKPKGQNRPNGGGRDSGASVTELQKPPKPHAPSKGPNRRLTLGEIRTDLMVRNATGRAFGSQKEAADHSVTRSRATPNCRRLGSPKGSSRSVGWSAGRSN